MREEINEVFGLGKLVQEGGPSYAALEESGGGHNLLVFGHEGGEEIDFNRETIFLRSEL